MPAPKIPSLESLLFEAVRFIACTISDERKRIEDMLLEMKYDADRSHLVSALGMCDMIAADHNNVISRQQAQLSLASYLHATEITRWKNEVLPLVERQEQAAQKRAQKS